MDPIRSVVVFDAADLHAESAFWAGMLDGHVFDDETFHCVIDSTGEWRIGVQLSPVHVPPDWPDSRRSKCTWICTLRIRRKRSTQAIRLGARLLKGGDLESDEGNQVYADPAGHPFCIGWGQPSRDALAAYVRGRLG